MAVTELDEAHERNQAAFRRMKASLDEQYPPGRFLALAEEQVVADAPTIDSLIGKLAERGVDRQRTLVVQAGINYPTEAVIFTPGPVHAP
jgi:hypothetical protein